MKITFDSLMKAVIGGAGAGYALSGGLSFIPFFTVTAGVAYSFALGGSLLLSGLYIKKIILG